MEVRFRNFRCFKDTGLVRLKKISLLVGENSSGKSSFLAGVNHLLKLHQLGSQYDESAGPNIPPFNLGSFRDIVHTDNANAANKRGKFFYDLKLENTSSSWEFGNSDQEVVIKKVVWTGLSKARKSELELDMKSGHITMRTELSDEQINAFRHFGVKVRTGTGTQRTDNDKMCIVEMKYPRFVPRSHRYMIHMMEHDMHYAITYHGKHQRGRASKERNESKLKDSDHSSVVKELLESITSSFVEFRERGFWECVATFPLRSEPERHYSIANYGSASFDSRGANLPLRMRRDKNSFLGHYNAVLKAIEEFGAKSGLFKKIHIENLGRDSGYPFSLMVETASGRKSNIKDVGYGVFQILPLIYEVLAPSDSMQFLIQQPEVHLHPRAQAEFGTLLANIVGRTRGEHDGFSYTESEFLIETHSDFIVDRLKHEIATKKISNNDVGILFFDTSDNEVTIHQLDLDEEGLPIDPPNSYRDFFLEELDRTFP